MNALWTAKNSARDAATTKGLLVLAALATVLALASPAAAQTASEEGALPPENQVTEDGVLIYQGDMGVECRSLLEAADNPNSPLIQEQVRACTEAGFPPDGALPETGGAPPILVPAFLLLASGGLLAYAARLREDA